MVYSAGTQVGDFCIERRIGRGGMASVYSAMQCSVERRVALKIIEFQPESSRDFLKRFTREAEVIARLEHIHILPIYAYGVVEGELAYLAMRLIEHGTLADLIAKQVLPLEEALDLFAQIASGLEHMHNQGVIHRDLKPSNILLDENHYVYLSDFGLARSNAASQPISEDAMHIAGSPHYLAPELLQGEPATNLSDIYSLGIILYQMLTGHLPFEAENGRVSALMYKQLRESPLPPRQFNPELPPEVEAVVLRTMSKNPRERYASASEVVYALHEALERVPSRSPLRQFSRSSARSLPNLQRSARHLVTRRRLRYAATALTLCLLLIGTTFAWDRLRALPKPMNILSGESGTFATMSVSGDEVADAQARLEPDGFIAHFPCTMSSAYQVTQSRELADMATEYGLPLRVYESHDDPTAQSALIDRARFDGAKIIVLCPLSQTLLTHAIASLEDAAIPLVLTAPYNTTYGVKVEIDNYLVGEKQGAYAAELLHHTHDGRGNIILLIATETATGAQRAQGTHDALIAAAPNAAIAGTLLGYTRQQGYESTRNYLASGQPLAGIVTQTDAGALGAIDALQEAGISPDDVFIVSSNNESAIRGYIADGYYVRASMDTNRAEHSQLIMDSVIKLLAGSPVPEHVIRSGGGLVTAETLLQDKLASR